MISEETPLILASRSPRRSELLRGIAIPFITLPLDVDESVLSEEQPANYVARIAEKKLDTARRQLLESKRSFAGVLTADTTVAIDGTIVGKPADEQESLSTISSLCGRSHFVYTSYALFCSVDGRLITRTVCTEVRLRAASLDELKRYVATGDGLDKAGAYSIQGRGGFLVESIAGSYSNVVGLPLCELVSDMKEFALLVEYP